MLRSFQQFLGLSRRSQPLPPRLHLPCCGGGSVVLAARLVGFFFFFFCRDLNLGSCFPYSPYRGPRLDDPLRVALGGPRYRGWGARREGWLAWVVHRARGLWG